MYNGLLARICKSENISELERAQLEDWFREITQKAMADKRYAEQLTSFSTGLITRFLIKKGEKELIEYYVKKRINQFSSRDDKISYCDRKLSDDVLEELANDYVSSCFLSENTRRELEQTLSSDKRESVIENIARITGNSVDDISGLQPNEILVQLAEQYKIRSMSDDVLVSIMNVPENELKIMLGDMYQEDTSYDSGIVGHSNNQSSESREEKFHGIIQKYGSDKIKAAVRKYYAKKGMNSILDEQLDEIVSDVLRGEAQGIVREIWEIGKEQQKLIWLARANCFEVRKAIAEFRYAPEEALEYLAMHCDREVTKASRTGNPDPNELESAIDRDNMIKKALLKNTGTSQLALHYLTEAEIASVFHQEEFVTPKNNAGVVSNLVARIEDITSSLRNTDDPQKIKELNDELDSINHQLKVIEVNIPTGLRINMGSEREVIELLGKNARTPICDLCKLDEELGELPKSFIDLSREHWPFWNRMHEPNRAVREVREEKGTSFKPLDPATQSEIKEKERMNNRNNIKKGRIQELDLAHVLAKFGESQRFVVKPTNRDLMRSIFIRFALEQGENGTQTVDRLVDNMRALQKHEKPPIEPFSKEALILGVLGFETGRDESKGKSELQL